MRRYASPRVYLKTPEKGHWPNQLNIGFWQERKSTNSTTTLQCNPNTTSSKNSSSFSILKGNAWYFCQKIYKISNSRIGRRRRHGFAAISCLSENKQYDISCRIKRNPSIFLRQESLSSLQALPFVGRFKIPCWASLLALQKKKKLSAVDWHVIVFLVCCDFLRDIASFPTYFIAAQLFIHTYIQVA